MARRRILLLFNDVVDTIGGIGLTLMLFCVLLQVFVRYFINLIGTVSFAWTEELARFFLIFVTFWGAAIALRRREHINIPFLLERVSPRSQLVLQLVFVVVMGIFLVVVFSGSLTMVRVMWNTPVGSGLRWLSVGKVYTFVPMGTGLMILYLILWAVEICGKLRTKDQRVA
ncbi:MAG: TRAP transporter small permease subunit [candidate division WOR-3 bacterium]